MTDLDLAPEFSAAPPGDPVCRRCLATIQTTPANCDHDDPQ